MEYSTFDFTSYEPNNDLASAPITAPQRHPPPPPQPPPIMNMPQPQYVPQVSAAAVQVPHQPGTSIFDKMMSKKRECVKMIIIALVIAFAISLSQVFNALLKYMRFFDNISQKQEFVITVFYAGILLISMWVLKSLM